MNTKNAEELANWVCDKETEDFADCCTDIMSVEDCQVVHDWIRMGGYAIPKKVKTLVKKYKLVNHPYFRAAVLLEDLL